MHTMFGGSEAEQQSTSNPVDLNPFKDLRGDFGATLQSLYKSGGAPGYSGPFTPDINDAQKRAMAGTEALAFDPTRSQYLKDSMEGKFLPGQAGGNPFFTAALQAAQRPTLQGLEETLSRALPGRFTAAGHLTTPHSSGAFDRSAALATRGAADAIGDIATNMGNAAWTGGRTLQQNAVQLQQQDLDQMVKNLTAQSLPMDVQERGIGRAMEGHNQRIDSLMKALQMMAGITAPNIANVQQSTGSSSSEKGIVPGLLPKGLQAG